MRRDLCVARCVLGLTLYTRHLPDEGARGVARLLESYVELAPAGRLVWFRTSLTPTWHRVAPTTVPTLVEELARTRTGITRARHLFSLHLADSEHAPECFFSYVEADEDRGAGCGYVQLGLPVGAPPEHLFQLAMEAAHHVPAWCGVGGFTGSAHPVERCSSFSAFWIWSRRYVGLDVQDADRARHRAHAGLPSVNWITWVGADLVGRARMDGAALRARAAESGIDCLEAPRGLVVRAGSEPTLGDTNRMELATHYQRASELLAPLSLDPPVRMYGRFWDGDESERWAKRFVEPQGWAG